MGSESVLSLCWLFRNSHTNKVLTQWSPWKASLCSTMFRKCNHRADWRKQQGFWLYVQLQIRLGHQSKRLMFIFTCTKTLYHFHIPENFFDANLTLWRRNYFLILAHSVYKMWIMQEPIKLELWNKLHFEEKKKTEYRACLKYSLPIFVE